MLFFTDVFFIRWRLAVSRRLGILGWTVSVGVSLWLRQSKHLGGVHLLIMVYSNWWLLVHWKDDGVIAYVKVAPHCYVHKTQRQKEVQRIERETEYNSPANPIVIVIRFVPSVTQPNENKSGKLQINCLSSISTLLRMNVVYKNNIRSSR